MLSPSASPPNIDQSKSYTPLWDLWQHLSWKTPLWPNSLNYAKAGLSQTSTTEPTEPRWDPLPLPPTTMVSPTASTIGEVGNSRPWSLNICARLKATAESARNLKILLRL